MSTSTLSALTVTCDAESVSRIAPFDSARESHEFPAPEPSKDVVIADAIASDSPPPVQSDDMAAKAETLAKHTAAITEIVGMIREGFADTSTRNFSIGKRALTHMQWQRGNFPDFGSGDFDHTVNQIKTEVRLYVAISADSIRVAEWVRGTVLRDQIATVVGDAAGSFTMFEMIAISPYALSFSKADLTGELSLGWAPFFVSVVADRNAGNPVCGDKFVARAKDFRESLKAAKNVGTVDPEKVARDLANKANKDKAAAKANAEKAVMDAISDALSADHLNGSGVMAIVETASKALDKPLPPEIGFNPATCTIADCDTLASALFQSGKLNEMIHLRDKLSKMIAVAERAKGNLDAGMTAETRISNPRIVNSKGQLATA